MGFLDLLKTAAQSAIHKLTAGDPIKQLRAAHRRRELVLVLGSGASDKYGLPSWDALLQALLIRVQNQDAGSTAAVDQRDLAELFNEVFHPGPLIAARYIRRSVEEAVTPRRMHLEEKIREVLYADLPPEDFDSKLMKEIRRLCAAPGDAPPLDAIITYNYDDILERCLERLDLDIPFKPIHSIGMQPHAGQLPIYHVHGYLPRKGPITEKHRITLAEDAYHAQYMDVYSWNNMVQINKFRERTCLFIGISLTDPNQRRLLDIARKQRGDDKHRHFLFRKTVSAADVLVRLEELGRGQAESVTLQATERLAVESTQRVQRNLKTIQEPTAATGETTSVADSLAKLMRDFYEKDGESFGISTIWIDDFEEIPKILEDIRTFKDA